MKRGSLVLLVVALVLSSLAWAQKAQVGAAVGLDRVTNAYGILIQYDNGFVTRFRQLASKATGEAIDVKIEINGRKTTMTFEEFEKRVFEKEAK